MKKDGEKKSSEYSKSLLNQESVLIWIMSLSFIILAFYCIYKGFTGSLPWLSSMVGFPWSAYGISQAMYYRKSMAENTTGGVKFESVLKEADQVRQYYKSHAESDYTSVSYDDDGDIQITYTDVDDYII